MASGQQIAAENVKKFEAWTSERQASEDWGDYIRRNQLNRSEIAKECCFASSVLRQNPSIKSKLEELESQLRDRGILSLETRSRSEQAVEKKSTLSNSMDKNRIKKLEEENAANRCEMEALKESLRRYELFETHLADTGRRIKS